MGSTGSRREWSPGQVLPGNVLAAPRLGRHAQPALGDDRTLDLVRAAGDAIAGSAEDVLPPDVGAPLAAVDHQPRAQDPPRARGDVWHPAAPLHNRARPDGAHGPPAPRAGPVGGNRDGAEPLADD